MRNTPDPKPVPCSPVESGGNRSSWFLLLGSCISTLLVREIVEAEYVQYSHGGLKSALCFHCNKKREAYHNDADDVEHNGCDIEWCHTLSGITLPITAVLRLPTTLY